MDLNLDFYFLFTIVFFIVWFFIIIKIEVEKENNLNDLNNFIMKKMKEVNESNYYELKHIEGLEFQKEERIYAKILNNKLEIGNSDKKKFLDFDKIKMIDFNIKEEEYEDVISNTLVKHTFLWSELKISYLDNNKNIKKIVDAFKNPREYPSLGRREDIIVIENVKVVEIEEKELEKDTAYGKNIYAYIPVRFIKENLVGFGDKKDGVQIAGTKYQITKNYNLKNVGTKAKPKEIRLWEKKEVIYSSDITGYEESILPVDSDGDIVFCDL